MAAVPDATLFLVRSGLLQIAWTTLLGWLMLLPHQAYAPALAVRLRSEGVRHAHVDWVMLALVQFAAAYALTLRKVPDADFCGRLIAFNAWYAPVVYFLRPWGINGFRLDGKKVIDTVVGSLGFVGICAFTYGWGQIAWAWW